jgi:hypothetical protein
MKNITESSITTSSKFRDLLNDKKQDLRGSHILVLRRLDYEIYYINDRILHKDVTSDFGLNRVQSLLYDAKIALESVGCSNVVIEAFKNKDGTIGRSYCYRFEDSDISFTGKSTPKYISSIS